MEASGHQNPAGLEQPSVDQMLASLVERDVADYAYAVAERYDQIEQAYNAALGAAPTVRLAASTNRQP